MASLKNQLDRQKVGVGYIKWRKEPVKGEEAGGGWEGEGDNVQKDGGSAHGSVDLEDTV